MISLKLQLEIGSNRPVATLLLKLHLKKILVHISIHIISYYWLTYLSTFLGMRYILSLAVDPGGGPWARGPPPVPYILSSGNFWINNVKTEEQFFCKKHLFFSILIIKNKSIAYSKFSHHTLSGQVLISACIANGIL